MVGATGVLGKVARIRRRPLLSAALRETAAATPKPPGGGGKGAVRICPGMRYGFLTLETSSGHCAATCPPCGARKLLRAYAFPCSFRPLRKKSPRFLCHRQREGSFPRARGRRCGGALRLTASLGHGTIHSEETRIREDRKRQRAFEKAERILYYYLIETRQSLRLDLRHASLSSLAIHEVFPADDASPDTNPSRKSLSTSYQIITKSPRA